MPKTYELVTLEDLLQVPADRREACLREVLYAMALHDVAICGNQFRGFHSMAWTDDNDMRIELQFGDSEHALTLRGTSSADGKPAIS